jgi:hypothetical protein
MIHLVLDPSASAGAVSSSTIRLETTYLGSFGSSAAIQEEARGMLHFFVAHLYQRGVDQTPSWLVSGKADFVRLSAGLLAGSSPAPGGTWTDGFRTTAFFLAHIEESHPDFVYSLNLKMAAEGAVHDDAWFEELTGTNLSALWDAYQASF